MCLTYASGPPVGGCGGGAAHHKGGVGVSEIYKHLSKSTRIRGIPPTVHAPRREPTQYNQRNPPTICQASESNARRDEIY